MAISKVVWSTEQELSDLFRAAAIFKGARQQRVTDKGKEIPGSMPIIGFTSPQSFASDGLDLMDSDNELSHAQPVNVPQQPRSSVRYRQMTLVYIKPARGSLERVLLAQLLEPVVQVEVLVRSRGRRRRGNQLQVTTRFSIEKPSVRYFSPTDTSEDGHQQYEYDSSCASTVTVDVSAIYGAAQYCNSVVSLEGLIESFEVDMEDIDKMEDEVNREMPVVSSSEDEEDEE